MSEPTAVHDIVAVLSDPEMARGVARRIESLGIPPWSIRMNDAAANVEAMKAEMREEADNTIVGPGSIGPFTREMSRGIVRQVAVWTLALAVLAAPVGLIGFIDLPVVTRVVIAAAVGAVAGSVIGFMLGGGLGAKDGYDPLATERGITLSITTPDTLAAEVVRIVCDAQPLRLDLGSLEGSPLETVINDVDRARRRTRR
jgi:hypothetical protein